MNPIILDIRTPQEFAQGHVQGAVNVPTPVPPLDQAGFQQMWNGLYAALGQASKQTPIWVYCKKGIRAEHAAKMIRRMGFRDIQNLGGIEQEPLPSMVQQRQLTWVA